MPFFNEKFTNETKKFLLDKVENSGRFKLPQNKHLLTLQSNKGLHYFTSSFKIYDDKTKLAFIKMIDNYIADRLAKNKYDEEFVWKDRKVKALKRLKKLILQNKGDKQVFGRHVKTPEKDHLVCYKAIEKSMKALPRKPNYMVGKYMEKLDKELIKRSAKTPQTHQYHTNNTTNNFYSNTSTTYSHNDISTNVMNTTHKISQNPHTTLTDKDKDNNFYYNTKTSFFSCLNTKTVASSHNNNDDLSFSNSCFFTFNYNNIQKKLLK